MKNSFFIFLVFIFTKLVSGQTSPQWIIYNTSNSLIPSNYVNHIVVDDINRKWVSLPGFGILKIDNEDWTVYNTGNSDIPSNSFASINVDGNSNFWGGGYADFILTRFDGINWTVWNDPAVPVPGVVRTAIEFDEQNNVWFLSRNEGPFSSTFYIIEFSEDSIWTTHTSFNTTNSYRQLVFDNNQTLWIGDGEGLYFYDGNSLQFIQSTMGPMGLYVTDVKLDSSGNLWIALGLAGWGNLIKYDGNSFTGFPPMATAIEVDSAGNIWIGTESIFNEVELIKYDGINFTTYTPSNSPLPATYMITDLAFDKFGNLWIGTLDSGLVVFNENGIIVPVELESFMAEVSGNNIHLFWITASEINNMRFEVERSQDYKIEKLQDWKAIGFVEGKGTTTETNYYSFVDEGLSSGEYSYRLKQIDFDGTFEYSNVIEVEVGIPEHFALFQNYPNPFNPSTKIKFSIPQAYSPLPVGARGGLVTLKVYDVLGREVATIVNEEKQPGVYEVEFNASQLASGIYYYQLNAGSYIETKKMIYLK